MGGRHDSAIQHQPCAHPRRWRRSRPVAVFVLGLGTLALGIVSRYAGAVAYDIVARSFLLALIGSAINANGWPLDLSVFHHLAPAPASDPNWTSAAVLAMVGIAAAAVGALAFGQRDLAAAQPRGRRRAAQNDEYKRSAGCSRTGDMWRGAAKRPQRCVRLGLPCRLGRPVVISSAGAARAGHRPDAESPSGSDVMRIPLGDV